MSTISANRKRSAARYSQAAVSYCPIPDRAWRGIGLQLQLTDRELEIIRALFDGDGVPEVARTLGISANTVHTHMTRMYRKLGVRNRSQLLLLVVAQYV